MYYGPETACSSFYFSCNHIEVALLALIFKLWRVPMRSSKLKYPASVRSRRLWQSHPVLALLAAYRTNCTFLSLFFFKESRSFYSLSEQFPSRASSWLKNKKKNTSECPATLRLFLFLWTPSIIQLHLSDLTSILTDHCAAWWTLHLWGHSKGLCCSSVKTWVKSPPNRHKNLTWWYSPTTQPWRAMEILRESSAWSQWGPGSMTGPVSIKMSK